MYHLIQHLMKTSNEIRLNAEATQYSNHKMLRFPQYADRAQKCELRPAANGDGASDANHFDPFVHNKFVAGDCVTYVCLNMAQNPSTPRNVKYSESSRVVMGVILYSVHI